jgi:catechol 2,3-dioxygenase-like lactoylglutathione lyase family enzyme
MRHEHPGRCRDRHRCDDLEAAEGFFRGILGLPVIGKGPELHDPFRVGDVDILDRLEEMRLAEDEVARLRVLDLHQANTEKTFPAVARWVKEDGWIEIGVQDLFGFVARALHEGGTQVEDDRPDSLAEALAALEKGLVEYYEREGIES